MVVVRFGVGVKVDIRFSVKVEIRIRIIVKDGCGYGSR